MAALSYNEILKGLDQLDASEIRLLLIEVERRTKSQPKRKLSEFRMDAPLKPSVSDWVADLRKEWDESSK